MEKVLRSKMKWVFLAVFFVLVVLSVFMVFQVKINYDLTEYLPKDSETAQGIAVLEKEFGDSSAIQIMVNDRSPMEGKAIAEKLETLEGVSSVVWLGSAVNPLTPLESIDENLLERFFQNGSLLFSVTLDCDSYSIEAETILARIRESLAGENFAIRGEVLDNIEARKIAAREIFKVLLIVVPLCIIILLFIGKSWFEPILILGNLAVAVALNMGTNALMGSVSYITMTMTMALQLALSMDYSLFLLHRYQEERALGIAVIPAIALATRKTFASITGSALTTIAGFIALCLMRYSIGTDLGVVLSKGILCSYITAILLMPILLFLSAKLLEKTAHRPLLIRKKPIKPRSFRGRYVLTILSVLLIIGSYFLQTKNSFIYGNSSASDPDSTLIQDKLAISAKFGEFNPVVVLVKNADSSAEIAFLDRISASPYFTSADALSTVADVSIPREMLPDSLLSVYVSGAYTRIIVYLASGEENPELYAAAAFLDEQAHASFDQYYLVGFVPATAEIRSTVLADSDLVLWVTFLAILFVTMFLFRSAFLPILLTVVIQGAVWINFAIGYLQGRPLLYIGFLIVSALQMGGTVDYGILLCSRYMEFRTTESPTAAMQKAMGKSTLSILTSSLVLAFAGFAEGIISVIPSVSAIGYLIGRGALLSATVILLFLPSILILFDKVIQKTTYHVKRGKLK